MRTFIAMDIQENKAIRDLYQYLSRNITGAKIKYTVSEHNHLTLAFLGEINQGQAALLINELSGLQLEETSITLHLTGFGAFYSNRTPSVIWIGIEHNEKLQQLHNAILQHVQNIGIKLDTKKDFSPHITVGRVKFAEKNNNIPAIIEKFKSAEFGVLKLNKFSLYKSTLTPNGPIYEVLKSFPFQ